MSNHYDIIIIGSGPAGYTAALYASRANLEVALFEGNQPGGQLVTTTHVENFPGFVNGIQGPDMMQIFKAQSTRFGATAISETIVSVELKESPFILKSNKGTEYTCDSLIIATGATAKRHGAKGEDKYWGAGISACATCDGYFFKGENIFVVGGGDSAMEEAIYLTNFAEKVTIVHRRETFRASKIMLERAQNNPKIDFLLNVTIEEFLGEEKGPIKKLTGLKLKNVETGEIFEAKGTGCFLAIGHMPNTDIFKDMLEYDENGYIITKGKSTFTNIPGVFACGDVQDHTYKQAITAAGSGCMAAIDAERWLAEYKPTKVEHQMS